MGKLFIISAPSGAGKTSLVRALLQRIESGHSSPNNFWTKYPIERVITYTSRIARVGEQGGG